MSPRLPANGQDMSGEDFSDGAWDSNELMRDAGTPESEPIGPDDDDEVEGEAPETEEQETGDIDGDEEAPELEADDEDGDDTEEEAEGDEAEGEEGEEEELGAIDPPANWPEQEKQFFAELPPALQHAYLDRARHMVADYTKKTQALSNERQYYNQLNQIISPRVQGWALNGMSPVQAIHQVLALSDYAAQDPVGFALHLCNLRGVDLRAALAQDGQQADNEYVDPQVKALRQPLAQVQAQLNQMQQQQVMRERQQQQAQYQAQFRHTSSAIDQFASRTDAQGKPLYPHFDDVIGDITKLVYAANAAGDPINMDHFYRIACQANPHIAAKIAARSRASENAKRRQQTEEARRAASSVRSSIPANGSIPTENMSVGDVLRAAYRQEIQ